MAVIMWKNIMTLRGVAMCMVALAHASNISYGPFLCQNEIVIKNQPLLTLISMFFVKSFVNFGIPAFLFASGFLTFRMYSGVKGQLTIVADLLKKYLIWAIPLYLIYAILNRELDISKILDGLIKGGPMPAYWFFIVIIVLMALSPIFIHCVKNFRKTAITCTILLQATVFVWHYGYGPIEYIGIIENIVIRPLLFAPPFVLGMLISANSTYWGIKLDQNRRRIMFIVVLSVCLCIIESVVTAYVDDWKLRRFEGWFVTERVSLMAFFLFATLFLVSGDQKGIPYKKQFDKIGMSSMGIFLMTDISNRILSSIIWHLSMVVTPAGLPGPTHVDAIPEWLITYGAWLLPIYFLNGLFLPIMAMEYSRRFFGKRVNMLW